MIKSYKVFGINYEIRYYKRKIFDDKGNELAGDVCHETKLIRISLRQSIEEQKKTLIHEIGHIINRLSGVGGTISEELDEVIVESFAQGLYGILGNHIDL